MQHADSRYEALGAWVQALAARRHSNVVACALARLVDRAVDAINRMDLDDDERQAWIAEIEAAFEAVAGQGLTQFDL